MERPKICLTLTGTTLAEDLEIIEKYRNNIDMVELRADFLTNEERLEIRKFPHLAGLPCILTIRREQDGGKFMEGEAVRTVLFARALSFADSDKNNNFQYVDFEEDFRISSLQDAALAFGTRIIRSFHDMENPVPNILKKLESLCTTGYEIPKIAFMPHTLSDVTNLFNEASRLKDNNHILIAMGALGVPSRILSAKLKNYLTFVSPASSAEDLKKLSHLDPKTMTDLYHFKSINDDTKIYGITGWPLSATSSPELHNSGYKGHGLNAVYVPVKAETAEEAVTFANAIGMEGLSVTVPHKEKVLDFVDEMDDKVKTIGASNTIVKKDGKWYSYNTDTTGFTTSLLAFVGEKNLKGWKVAIIGAGGASKAIAYSIKMLGGKACVFNRTVEKAKELAELYGFEYCGLGPEYNAMATKYLKKYSDLIVQTTSVGMGCQPPSTYNNDPISFYDFTGKEMVFDIVYVPSTTPIMHRASLAGCKVCNGFDMLRYQGYEQFELFTGKKY